jgi:predicted dehydrogenase
MPKTVARKVGIIMDGACGRMGSTQHLMRSIVAIVKQGGVKTAGGEVIMPDPILVNMDGEKLKALAKRSGVEKWTTDVDACLQDPSYEVYFNSRRTDFRAAGIRKAIEAGKHIYCEKPTALTSEEAYGLYVLARKAGVKNGVVQDKLWLPGFVKLRKLIDSGFFGEILTVRGDFGYWVFTGESGDLQRPSWNYRKADGGGIIMDMFCHWRYVLDNLFGAVKSVCCLGATHVKKRWDENAKPYTCTADDAAYGIMELEGGIIAQFNSSWAVRVRRDDLLTIQVDGTKGSAVAGLRKCWTQPLAETPRAVWNPDVDQPHDFRADWSLAADEQEYDNAFKIQWELFLRHVAADEPFRWSLLEGAKGVQLAEKAMESWQKRAWVDVPQLAEA